MKVGDKILCINDSKDDPKVPYHIFQNWVKLNEEYIIREVYPANIFNGGIKLEGIYNKKVPISEVLGGLMEPAFHPRRFVKITPPTQEEMDAIPEFVPVEEKVKYIPSPIDNRRQLSLLL